MSSLRNRLVLALLTIIFLPSAFALVSVSQLGFHPDGVKMMTVYTSASNGTYSILNAANATVKTGQLVKARDFTNITVNCQGNNPCLVADFSDFKTPGTYRITTSFGESSRPFNISTSIYRDNTPLFNEFFDALAQQNSSYHANQNSFADPTFNAMADGSFLMTSNFAAITLVRMGDAYRKNPVALSSDKRTIIKSGTPDLVEHMILYVKYLEALQDTKLLNRTDGVGFRTNTGMQINYAFVPGPTNLTTLAIYDGGNGFIQNEPVISLCGNLSGAAYTSCVNNAAVYYKCQVDEPCLQLTYTDKTATSIQGQTDGLGVDEGWLYEFGCFYDVDLQNGNFNSAVNPCMVYDPTESRSDTAKTLLAYTQAVPGINAYDPALASELVGRSIQTQQYIKTAYPAFASGNDDAGFFGAASFLLYDLTGNVTFLDDAYNLRSIISATFVADQTRGNEFYWQEYVRHKAAINAAGKMYLVGATDPAEYFRGKMYGDYKDRGLRSIGANGEHVYQFDNNIQFQNSRYMLTEGLLAAKTKELSSDTNPLIGNIADSQLAWLTGNNGVDLDSGFTNDIQSVSFIFGIGQLPKQYHSRLLMDSGYSAASGGQVKGMRGSGLKFNNGTAFVYMDGRTNILGTQLGAQGNNYRGEPVATQLVNKNYTNGKTYIPGWINGAFDLNTDSDDIYNYRDNRETYEFTESTNEIVATALSLFAYSDARYNNVTALAVPFLGSGNFTVPNGTGNSTNTTSNTSNAGGCFASVQSIPVNCTGIITEDTFDGCRHLTCATGSGSLSVLACDKPDGNSPTHFEMYKQSQTGDQLQICIGATCMSDSGFVMSSLFPICVNGTGSANSTNTTNSTNSTVQNISFSAVSPVATSIVIAEPQNQTFSYVLTNPSGLNTSSRWLVNGSTALANVPSFTFPGNFTASGTYNITALVFSSANNLSRSWTLVVTDTNVSNASNATNSTNATNSSVCYSGVQNIPANCTGGIITTDTFNGCRTITCTNGGNSLRVLACDKAGFFEMYKQAQVGSAVSKICIDGACISDNGYAKSTNFPICVGTTNSTTNSTPTNISFASTSPAANPTITLPNSQTYSFVLNNPSNVGTAASWLVNGTNRTFLFNLSSVSLNGTPGSYNITLLVASPQNSISRTWLMTILASNSTNSNSTNATNSTGSASLGIAPWFPQGKSYVFVCNATGFTPTAYDFNFGDGHANNGRTTNDVYYTYAAAGNFNVSCTAKNTTFSKTGSLMVNVA